MTEPTNIETRVQYHRRRLATLQGEYASWLPVNRELAKNFAPTRGRWLSERPNRADQKPHVLVNETPIFALRTLASGMMAGLTSPARPWFQLTTSDMGLRNRPGVKDWLYSVQNAIRDVLARSNIYNALHVMYLELGGFGTGCMLLLEDFEDVIRAYPYTAGQYYLTGDAQGRLDTFYRPYKATVRQLVEYFCPLIGGVKTHEAHPHFTRISKAVQEAWKRQSFDEWVDVLHSIEPNHGRQYGRVDNANMPFAECYVECGNGAVEPLRQGGYEENPVLSARWEIGPEDVYGTPPARTVLGSAKALQLQEKRKAKAIDKHLDPPMVGHTSLKGQRASLLPGDVTYVDMTAQHRGFEPAHEVNPNVEALLLDIESIEARIKHGLYMDLFLMLAQSDRREITAREIEERHEEKLLMLGPVLERLNDELLDPLIDRVFAIMLRKGLIPPPPPELEGVELKVEYISVLAQAQKSVATKSIERLTQFVGLVASGAPEAMDKFDVDEAIDQYADAVGTPPKIVRGDDDVKARREARAKQQQAAQLAASAQPAQQAAQAVKALSETETKQGSVLDRVLGNA